MPVAIVLLRGRSVLTAHQSPATPFTLGKWGYLCNIVSVIFVSVTTVFFCFPVAVPVTPNTMNYVSAVIGIFLVLLTTYWFVYGGRFEGPKFELIMGIAEEEREVVGMGSEAKEKEAKT
jgi:choline transport protein